MPVTLNAAERSRMGIHGEQDVDYVQQKDLIQVRAAGAFLLDRPDVPVLEAHPGDVVMLWSRVNLAPLRSFVGAEAHPFLLQHGFCSFPKSYTQAHIGPMNILFRCEQHINFQELPWMLTIWSEGEVRQ